MIDGYCERTGPGLWAEPLNAASNVAFLLASAALIWMIVRERRPVPRSIWLLPILLGVVGLCSLSFHTFADPFTAGLDSGSITVFVLTGVIVLTRWMWAAPWRLAWLAAPAFLVVAAGLTGGLVLAFGRDAALGGYIPSLVGLVAFGLAIRFSASDAKVFGNWMLIASGVFAVSLTLRTVDQPLCATFPTGTHFLWHCLNAVVLWIVSYTVIRRWRTLEPTSGEAVGGRPVPATH